MFLIKSHIMTRILINNRLVFRYIVRNKRITGKREILKAIYQRSSEFAFSVYVLSG